MSGFMTGIGTFVGVAGLIIAIAALFGSNGPASGSGPGGSGPGATNAARTTPAGRQRSPRLGLQFWQDGSLASIKVDPMRSGETEARVHVTLRRAAFELRLPTLNEDYAQICGWLDASYFSIPYQQKLEEELNCLGWGMGYAATEYGDGTFYLGQQGHHVYAGTSVIHMDGADSIQITQFQASSGAIDDGSLPPAYDDPVPVESQTNPVYLTVLVDHGHDGVIDPGDLELVVLDFAG
ncbi:MAG: hypothetical protein ACM30G_06520 [Micromonosporaceae bacterium]